MEDLTVGPTEDDMFSIFCTILDYIANEIISLFGKKIDEKSILSLIEISSILRSNNLLTESNIDKYVYFINQLRKKKQGKKIDKNMIKDIISLIDLDKEEIIKDKTSNLELPDLTSLDIPAMLPSDKKKLEYQTKKQARLIVESFDENSLLDKAKIAIYSSIILPFILPCSKEKIEKFEEEFDTICKDDYCSYCSMRIFTEKINRCGGCLTAIYCERGCQKAHWKKHKSNCIKK